MTIENKIVDIIYEHRYDERVYIALHEIAHAFRVFGRISNDVDVLASAEELYKLVDVIDCMRYLESLDVKGEVEEID